MSVPEDAELAATRPQAGQRLDQLGLPVALHAGDADDLAARTSRPNGRPRDLVALVEHREVARPRAASCRA